MYRKADWKNIRSAVMRQGGIILPEFLAPDTVAAIDGELLPWTRQVNFNEIYGSAILGINRWIFHLGIASLTALKLALDEAVLDLMESIFGEPAILAEFSYQEKLAPSPEHLHIHSDMDGGILVFYYLSGVNDEIGSTRFLPGTHEIGGSLQTEPTIFIDEKHYASRMSEIQTVRGGPGTTFIFDQDVWHDLPPVRKAGRRAVWCLYQPQSHPQCAVDHLYRQSYLAELSERQRRAYGIGMPAFGRNGYFRSIGQGLNIGHAKFVVKYLLRHRHFGRPKAAPPKSLSRPPRVRAPV